MPNDKLTLTQTDTTTLLSNLRGEVGEAITAWLLFRHFIIAGRRISTDDLEKDFSDRNILFTQLMADKLNDELIGRLSELAERKIGRLTFYFAARKMDILLDKVAAFEDFIVKSKIRDKRNRDISHKAFPGAKAPRTIDVPYRMVVRAVAMALRLMKQIDRYALGPSAPFLWRKARKKRYEFLSPPSASYMLVPYFNLTPEERIQIVTMELAEGRKVWDEMPTTIDGRPTTVLACKQWAVIVLGEQLLALDRYPLVTLSSLSTGVNMPTTPG
jgi:hypothetical protein